MEEDANFGLLLESKTSSKDAKTKFFDAPLIEAETDTFLAIGIMDIDQAPVKPSSYTTITSKDYTISVQNGQFQIN